MRRLRNKAANKRPRMSGRGRDYRRSLGMVRGKGNLQDVNDTTLDLLSPITSGLDGKFSQKLSIIDLDRAGLMTVPDRTEHRTCTYHMNPMQCRVLGEELAAGGKLC
jgi:hypothetical protein